MRLDLAERLRCPGAHAPTPLIVLARETRDRELRAGFAGCPVCHMEVPFVEGQLRFTASPPAADVGEGSAGDAATTAPLPDLERVIPLLGLGDPSGTVLLAGRYAALAAPLAAATGVSAIVLHGDPAPPADDLVCAVLGAPATIPFTDGTFRGAAIDASLPSALLADLPRVIVNGGRVVAAASVVAPPGLDELARDDREWVAAREVTGAMVELGRGRRLDVEG
ncbi:MAG: hypothetical protein KA761_02490 [Gemmatimonadaceae bacterium]|jgi:hypothetical protein|nr:hypothetical protein [Gemmatimonadaceae bacterium]